MSLMKILLFIPACFALNLTPGPNNLLALANGKYYGVRTACYASIGRLLAFAGMIALAAVGLATLLHTSEKLFLLIKVAGGLYLLWLAYQLWSADTSGSDIKTVSGRGLLQLGRQEFFLAAGNPKAILIFTAFLPQFVDPMGNVGEQFFLLGTLFLVLEWVAISGYAWVGKVLGHWFSRPEKRQLFNRICSGLLGSAGAGLIFMGRE